MKKEHMSIEQGVMREFVKFLRKKNVYTEYRKHTKTVNGTFSNGKPYSFFYPPISAKLDRHMSLDDYFFKMERLISAMRPWTQTPQGMDFWVSLSLKWQHRIARVKGKIINAAQNEN